MAYCIRFVHREDFYDIKSTGSFHKSMFLHIQKGCTKNTPLFRASYGLSRRAEARRMAVTVAPVNFSGICCLRAIRFLLGCGAGFHLCPA